MLFLMVFLGAALHFDVLPFEHFVKGITQFVFIGYTIPEILGMGKIASYKELTFALKLVLVVGSLFASFYLIGISFLRSARLQLKALSFGISIPLFLLLFQFWTSFVNDDRILLREDKMALFSFTLIVYLISVFLMWYGLHVRRVNPVQELGSSINPIRLHAIQSSIPSAEELSLEASDKHAPTKTEDAEESEREEETVHLAEEVEEGLAKKDSPKEAASVNLEEDISITSEVDGEKLEQAEPLTEEQDLAESTPGADLMDEAETEPARPGHGETSVTETPQSSS